MSSVLAVHIPAALADDTNAAQNQHLDWNIGPQVCGERVCGRPVQLWVDCEPCADGLVRCTGCAEARREGRKPEPYVPPAPAPANDDSTTTSAPPAAAPETTMPSQKEMYARRKEQARAEGRLCVRCKDVVVKEPGAKCGVCRRVCPSCDRVTTQQPDTLCAGCRDRGAVAVPPARAALVATATAADVPEPEPADSGDLRALSPAQLVQCLTTARATLARVQAEVERRLAEADELRRVVGRA